MEKDYEYLRTRRERNNNPLPSESPNPERDLIIWRCRHCYTECAGEGHYQLCNDCIKKDFEADNKMEIERCNQRERDNAGYEFSRDNNHYSNF